MFLAIRDLIDATTTGWATGVNDTGEQILYFLPPLLRTVVASNQSFSQLDDSKMRTAIELSGLVPGGADDAELSESSPAERTRLQTMTLVRDARFASRVLARYHGRCAMCGLGAPLVQAAHIYPVAAEGSTDDSGNGIALCANHHIAFDRHLVVVNPLTDEIEFSPDLIEAGGDDSTRLLIESTFAVIATPEDRAAVPSVDFFIGRYRFFSEHYVDWPLVVWLVNLQD